MVQTLHSMINKFGIDYVGSFDNIIVDECHYLIYEKVINQYNSTVLI